MTKKDTDLKKTNSVKSIAKTMNEKTRVILYLIAILIVFIPTYKSIYDTKVPPLGDNAMYYTLGKALANGQGYVNAHVVELSPSNHFPPGYPFFISMVMKFFNDDVATMHLANGFLYFFSLIVLFFLLANLTKNHLLSFIVTIGILFNQHLLQYSTWMMSEIPFMLITLLSLWMITLWSKKDFGYKNPYFYLMIISIAASYYVRAQGVALLGGLVLFLVFRKKWLPMLISLAGIAALIAPWMYRNSQLGEEAYSTALKLKNYYDPSQGLMQGSDWINRITENFSRYVNTEILSGVFGYEAKYEDIALTMTGNWFSGLLVLALIVFAIFRLKEYKWLIAGYLGATFAILLLWPQVWYGIRFMLAVVPLLSFLFFYGIAEIIFLAMTKMKIANEGFQVKVLPYFFLILLLVYFSKLDELKKKSNATEDAGLSNYYELAKWSKTNITDKNAVILCRKPTLFFMYSNHFVNDFPATNNPDSTIAILKRSKATHIVFTDAFPLRGFQEVYNVYPEKFPMLIQAENQNAYLFEFKPDATKTVLDTNHRNQQ